MMRREKLIIWRVAQMLYSRAPSWTKLWVQQEVGDIGDSEGGDRETETGRVIGDSREEGIDIGRQRQVDI